MISELFGLTPQATNHSLPYSLKINPLIKVLAFHISSNYFHHNKRKGKGRAPPNSEAKNVYFLYYKPKMFTS